MKVLALECSTAAGSLALLQDGVVAASTGLDSGQRRSQLLFDAAEDLLRRAGWTLREVDAFAAGRGPGSYTALRVSLTAVRGWALPAGRPVWTVSSATALAAEVFAECPEEEALVISGVARRGTIWAGRYERCAAAGARRMGEWSLLPEEARGSLWPGTRWVEAGRLPRAEWVGRLFLAGGASEDLQPIYLHPAVVVPTA